MIKQIKEKKKRYYYDFAELENGTPSNEINQLEHQINGMNK